MPPFPYKFYKLYLNKTGYGLLNILTYNGASIYIFQNIQKNI